MTPARAAAKETTDLRAGFMTRLGPVTIMVADAYKVWPGNDSFWHY